MEIKNFNQFMIDHMVFSLIPKKKHQKRLDAPENYRILNCKVEDAPIKLPPKNSSYETQIELQELSKIYSEYPKADKLEQKYDDDFLGAFKELCKANHVKYDQEYFETLVEEAASISIRLKYKFNRPRPYQLAKAFNLDFSKMDSNTAKTPSFPSGHTAQSQVVALKLSKLYPDLEEDFLKLADEISLSRLVGGHHFKSDIEYGKIIGTWMASTLL